MIVIPFSAVEKSLVEDSQELLHLVIVWFAGRQLGTHFFQVSKDRLDLFHLAGNLDQCVVHCVAGWADWLEPMEKD